MMGLFNMSGKSKSHALPMHAIFYGLQDGLKHKSSKGLCVTSFCIEFYTMVVIKQVYLF